MGLPLGFLVLILATVGYSAFSYNTSQATDSTLTFISANKKTRDVDPEYRCTGPPAYGPDRRPPISDCDLTIERLPNEGTVELFHLGGDTGIYQLPLRLKTFDCRLTVDIHKFFLADMYTWRGVREAATNLSFACQSPTNPSRTGGWTMTGILGRINISLAEPIFPPFKSNSTIELTEIPINAAATESRNLG